MIEAILMTATALALVSVGVFVIYFGTTRTWERTSEGRSLMAVALATGVLAAAACVKRVDEVSDLDIWPYLRPVVAIAWLIIAAVYAWRAFTLLPGRGQQQSSSPAAVPTD